MGRPAKKLDEHYAEIIRKESEKMSISDMYTKCVDEELDMQFSTFRKFVRSIAVLDMYRDGKTPEEIVEKLKVEGKHSRMTIESVRKILENQEIVKEVEVEDVQGETVVGDTGCEIEDAVENTEEVHQVVDEKPSVSVEDTLDIKELVSKLVRWGKNETSSVRLINDIEIYNIMLLSQLDGSILYIPYEVLRIFKYRIEHILDRNMDMTTFVAIGTLKVEGHNLIVISRHDQSSNLIKLQIVKSSRPQKDKNYDMHYIEKNYNTIKDMTSHLELL